ncbi:hypothetical protein DFP72DRAFT_202705 [Ephemerocybe angulata]|uniref:F-box domain-containing protein n=1 Tax=Ephemerocybe angulata TaxID=980116 RepID=A0A8H6MGW0_9AGAR|nr:hypothetical protein DFP72DRAFT_202705 [Tulosesus angulatus]
MWHQNPLLSTSISMLNGFRLAHFLDGNFDLEPIEIAFIKHEIEDRTAAISGLRLELQRLESERENYSKLLAPLRRNAIPPELLGQIFKFTLSTSDTTQEKQVNVLCLVCRRWRDVALATPSLWASVDLGSIRAPVPGLNFKRIKTWLARSGIVPKSLKFAGYHDSTNRCPIPTHELVELLVDGGPFGNLSLECGDGACLADLFDQTYSARTMNTTSLSTHSLNLVFEEYLSQSFTSIWTILRRFPALRRLSLDFPWYSSWIIPEDLPLANLRSLTLAVDWPLRLLLRLFRRSPNLETLVMDYKQLARDPNEVLPTDDEQVLLPNLRTLELRHMVSGSADTRILHTLRAPSLQSLEIRYGPDGDYLDEMNDVEVSDLNSNIISLTQGPHRVTDLQHLVIQALPISSSESLRPTLSALPTLSHLTFDSFEADSTLFENADYLGESKLMPSLKILKILNVPEVGEFNYKDVLNFLMERREAATEEAPDSVEEAELTIACESKYEGMKLTKDKHFVGQLAKEGVRVNITLV